MPTGEARRHARRDAAVLLRPEHPSDGAGPRMQSSGKTALGRSMFMVHRRWQLPCVGVDRRGVDVAAAARTTVGGRARVRRDLRPGWKELGAGHAFCERAGLPCLFSQRRGAPGRGRPGLLFDVLLARCAARGRPDRQAPARRRGWFAGLSRPPDLSAAGSGEAGAAKLAAFLRARGIAVSSRVLPADAPASGVTEAARRAASADAMVLWLRGPDVAALPGSLPKASASTCRG